MSLHTGSTADRPPACMLRAAPPVPVTPPLNDMPPCNRGQDMPQQAGAGAGLAPGRQEVCRHQRLETSRRAWLWGGTGVVRKVSMSLGGESPAPEDLQEREAEDGAVGAAQRRHQLVQPRQPQRRVGRQQPGVHPGVEQQLVPQLRPRHAARPVACTSERLKPSASACWCVCVGCRAASEQ